MCQATCGITLVKNVTFQVHWDLSWGTHQVCWVRMCPTMWQCASSSTTVFQTCDKSPQLTTSLLIIHIWTTWSSSRTTWDVGLTWLKTRWWEKSSTGACATWENYAYPWTMRTDQLMDTCTSSSSYADSTTSPISTTHSACTTCSTSPRTTNSSHCTIATETSTYSPTSANIDELSPCQPTIRFSPNISTSASSNKPNHLQWSHATYCELRWAALHSKPASEIGPPNILLLRKWRLLLRSELPLVTDAEAFAKWSCTVVLSVF